MSMAFKHVLLVTTFDISPTCPQDHFLTAQKKSRLGYWKMVYLYEYEGRLTVIKNVRPIRHLSNSTVFGLKSVSMLFALVVVFCNSLNVVPQRNLHLSKKTQLSLLCVNYKTESFPIEKQ